MVFHRPLLVGLYLYILRLPPAFAPVLLLFDLYVFLPVADTFAILLMTKFIDAGSMKRPPAFSWRAGLAAPVMPGRAYASVFLPFNLGIIAASLLPAPFVGYPVSRQIRQK